MAAEQKVSRTELKEQELKLLFEVYKNDPKLFLRPTFIEDAKTLADFGIYIPEKDTFPFGVIKFVPQDFIVEEVSESGEVFTIKKENWLSSETVLSEGSTLYATLVKCGLSTLQAAAEIATHFSCSPEQIRYAGLKDRDAITAQRLSFRQISLKQLKTLNSPHLFLKDVASGKGALEKGKLKGNQFTIFLRTEKTFIESGRGAVFINQLAKVREKGFYNYFYLQRFGTPRLIAHYLGMDLVHGYYRKALETFICFPSPNEIPYFKNIRKELRKNFGNWSQMLAVMESFPLILGNELKVVRYLEQKPEDFAGALLQIQDQAGMWVGAFSSWLFNQKVASYLKKGEEPPQSLPLFLDTANSGSVYKELMRELRVSVNDFRNLRKLPFIQAPKRPLVTRELVMIDKAEIADAGIVLKFFLPKGEYATTFLSHLFNLISDRPPIEIDQTIVDTKAALGDGSNAETLEYFAPVIHPKSANYFEELLKEEGQ